MCELCMKHGAGKKWYLNAQHYSDEIVEKYNLRDYLMEQYKNFEQVSVRKVHGFNAVGLDYKDYKTYCSKNAPQYKTACQSPES